MNSHLHRRSSWSDLPQELLDIIASRLETYEDLQKFRFVCKFWNSSVGNQISLQHLLLHTKLPYQLTLQPNIVPFNRSNQPFIIVSSDVYILRRYEYGSRWLVGVEQSSPGKLRLVHPLTKVLIKDLPTNFPKVLSNFCPVRLSTGYNIRFSDGLEAVLPNGVTNKVILWKNPNVKSSDPAEYSLVVLYATGILVCLRLLDKCYCTNITHGNIDHFCDVVEWEDGIWALDHFGKVYGIEYITGSVTHMVVCIPPFKDKNDRRKRLLVSNGELYLVVRQHSPRRMLVKFEVHVLNQRRRVWEKVTSLGDRVLFVSFDSCFFAKVNDLTDNHCRSYPRNCIVFPKHCFPMSYVNASAQDDHLFRKAPCEYLEIGVYDYDRESINFRLVSSDSGLSRVFWPPPPWIWDLEDAPPPSFLRTLKVETNIAEELEMAKNAKERKVEEKDVKLALPISKKSRTSEDMQPIGGDCEAEGSNNMSLFKAPFQEVDMAYKMLNPPSTHRANQFGCGKLKEDTLEAAAAAFKEFCTQFMQGKSPDDMDKILEMVREIYCQMDNCNRKKLEEAEKMSKPEKN